jgi:trimethylamine:corrinoid methyltransferase-like protein
MKIFLEIKMMRLYESAVRILSEVGCWIDHELLRLMFEKRGMKVEHAAKRVYFTAEIISVLLPLIQGERKPMNQFERPPETFDIEGSFPRYFDWATKSSRPGDTPTMLELLHVFSAMPQFDHVASALILSEVPQKIEPIIATSLVIQHSPRPGLGEVYHADNIPYLIELGEIATNRAGCTDFIAPWICIIPPLKITHDEGDLIIAKARAGVTSIPTTMPSSGVTAPVTREGTIAIELAEVMVVWLCSRIVNPKVPLAALFASSSFDMKTAECSFSSPEAVLQDCAASQICRHVFDVPTEVSCNYVDAKVPGIQATYEKLFKTFWTYMFQGHAVFKPGLLQAGQTFCPAQALLDAEMWGTASAFFPQPPSLEEEVPFDIIRQIAHQSGTFLDCDHTVKHFREVLHNPEFLDRTSRGTDQQEMLKANSILDRCQEYYEQVRKDAPLYRAPNDICRSLDQVVQKARNNLINGNSAKISI